eukprot:symbB.v1.2.016471.t1/scaffold1252.1/size200744/19
MQRSALSKSSSSPSLTQLSWERSSRSNDLLGSVRSCSGGWTTMTNGSSRSTTSLRKNMNKVCSTPAASQFEPPNVQQGMLQTVAAQALEREVFAFTASKILQAGAQGTGPHRVRCFEDRMLVAQRFGNITLPFKQITHAELDGRSCSLKLHLGMTGMLCDATVQQYPPGLLKIELQSAADLAMLRQAVWPTLMRYLLKPGPVPAFQVSSASWVCTNRVRTARELYSTSPQAGLRVCLTTGEGSFVQAGSLTIQALPDQMPVAWLSPTSTALGTASPLAVTFKFPTLPEESSNESMRLQLHFNLSQLEPLQVDGTLLSSPLFDEQPSAALCGRLFRELWANGSGFPHPRYCSSRAMGDNVSLIMQLLFDGGLLQSNHIYQIVVLALAKTSLDSALKLWLMGSSNPHLLYSVGVPELTQTFQDAAGPTDPHLSSVLGGSNGVLQLESGRNLELLIAGENARPIHGGAQLRIFLRLLAAISKEQVRHCKASICREPCQGPLTAWVAHGENSHGCSSLHVMKDLNSTQLESPCQVLSVVPSMAFNNLLKLTLPLEIGQVSEELAVEIGLGLPSGSFFAEQLVVEIRLPDSSKPHSAISSMNLLSWLPNSSAAVLISRQQTDSLAPFSATSNQLYLRLTLAATLRSLLEDSDPTGAAGFSLIAPLGYSLQAAVETSGVLESSRWSCTGRACKCTLPPFAAIWAGSAVVNPDWPLRRCSLRNVWQISLQAGGFHTTNLQVPASEASFRMQDGSACNFSEGVSVLGRISPALVQPTRLSVSPANGEFVTNTLQVFFTAEQGVEFPARLRIEAHEDFVFQDGSCADLPEMFYAADGKGSRTWALPVQRCETHGRYAMVSFVGSLLPQQEYGFQIEVWNPQHYDPSHQASWVLTTLTEAGEEVDQTSGSHQMRVVKADEDDGVGSALGLQVINGFPFAASGHEAQVIISPLRTAVAWIDLVT